MGTNIGEEIVYITTININKFWKSWHQQKINSQQNELNLYQDAKNKLCEANNNFREAHTLSASSVKKTENLNKINKSLVDKITREMNTLINGDRYQNVKNSISNQITALDSKINSISQNISNDKNKIYEYDKKIKEYEKKLKDLQ